MLVEIVLSVSGKFCVRVSELGSGAIVSRDLYRGANSAKVVSWRVCPCHFRMGKEYATVIVSYIKTLAFENVKEKIAGSDAPPAPCRKNSRR